MSDLNDWDITATNNNDGPPDGWPENTMQYSEVNNTGREGMAVLARFWKDINGALQFTGSVNVLAVTLNAGYAAYFQGMYLSAEINITNTGAVTLNVNAIGAKTVQDQSGGALTAGALVAGGIYEFRYDGTVFQLLGVVADGTITTAKLANDAVTYAKMQNVVADERILGNIAGAGGIVTELTVAQVLTMLNVEAGATADQTSIVGITGTLAEFDTALTGANFASGGGTVSGASSGTNTGDQTSIVGITGTAAQFNTANTGGSFALSGGAFHDGFSDFVGNEHINHTSVTLSGGDGITSTIGDISANRSISVDSSVIRTTGTQTIGGQKTFSSVIRAPSGSASAPAHSFSTDTDLGMLRGGTNILHWSCGNNIRMTLSAAGALVCDDDITAFSDERLKDNLEIIPDALAKVSQLNGYTFDRIDHFDRDTGKSLDTRRHAGVLAQEVVKVLPEVISENDDGILGTAYGNMAALFIEAIKELTGRLEVLEAA